MHGSSDQITPANRSVPDRLVHAIPEVAVLLGGVTERYVWHLVAIGELESFTIGKRRMVRRTAIDEFIDRMVADERQVRAAAAQGVA